MTVSQVLIGLQASRADGRGITRDEFIVPWMIERGEVEFASATGAPWRSGMLTLAVIRYEDFERVDDATDAGAASSAFLADLMAKFREAARFLERRTPEMTAALRASGMSLRIFVEVRMNEDQMDIEFPPEFLAACGRHSLGVYLITNDC